MELPQNSPVRMNPKNAIHAAAHTRGPEYGDELSTGVLIRLNMVGIIGSLGVDRKGFSHLHTKSRRRVLVSGFEAPFNRWKCRTPDR